MFPDMLLFQEVCCPRHHCFDPCLSLASGERLQGWYQGFSARCSLTTHVRRKQHCGLVVSMGHCPCVGGLCAQTCSHSCFSQT